MTDLRFFEKLGPRSLADIAQLTKARLDPVEAGRVFVEAICGLDAPTPDGLSFLVDARRAPALTSGSIGACFVREDAASIITATGAAAIVTPFPQAAFSVAVAALFAVRGFDAAGEPAKVAATAKVAPSAVIGSGARLDDRVVVGANAVIGPGVHLGPDVQIGPNAVVECADLGPRTVVGAGAVIGGAGFGLGEGPTGLVAMPHCGTVRIGADVSIGANTTIDRAVFHATTIGDGTKIDNLVQIAHNVRIGRHCIIAGCCGLSGSVVLEDGAILGGSVGVADHVTIGARARLAGATLVMRDVPAGETWAGAPARPIRAFFREVAALSALARRGGGG